MTQQISPLVTVHDMFALRSPFWKYTPSTAEFSMGAGAADTEDGSPFATDLSADTFIHTFICSEYKDHKMQQ